MTIRASRRAPAAALIAVAVVAFAGLAARAGHAAQPFGGVTRHAGGTAATHPILVAADVTGDTVPDAAWLSGADIRVMPRLPGLFGLQSTHATGLAAPGPMAAWGDLTGDGLPDVAVGGTGGAVSVLLNDGAGAYAPTVHALPRSDCRLPFLADADDDLDLDLYVVGQGLAIFENTGGGAFAAAGDSPGSVTQELSGVAVGDLDLDGRADVVLRALGGSHPGLDVLFTGPGTAPPGPGVVQVVALDPGLAPGAVVGIGDVDRDGEPDVVAHGLRRADGAPVTVVFRGVGARSFAALPASLSQDATGSPTNGLHVLDLDGDGRTDVLITCNASDCRRLVIHWGSGGGALDRGVSLPVLDGADRVVPLDLDCDGDLDLAGGGSDLVLAWNGGGRAWTDERVSALPGLDFGFADFDPDGEIDVVAVGPVEVFASMGAGCANAAVPACTAALPRAEAGADLVRCTEPGVAVDVALSGATSVPGAPAEPILRTCWRTDRGFFVESGAPDHCAAASSATLRLLPAGGRAVATVTLEVTGSSGCRDEDQVLVAAEADPIVSLLTPGPLTRCGSAPVDLSAIGRDAFAPFGLVTLTWDFDVFTDSSGNGVLDDDVDAVRVAVSGAVAVVSTTYTQPGAHRARVTAAGTTSSCLASAELDVTVHDQPQVSPVSGPFITCPRVPRVFSASAFVPGGATPLLAWDFDTGLDSSGNGDPADDVEAVGSPVSWAFPLGGQRIVRVRAVTADGCAAHSERTVTVLPTGVASFVATSGSCSSTIVTFTDTTPGAAASEWIFGDGTPSRFGSFVTHAYAGPGAYQVTHVVFDGNGCRAETSRPVVIGDVTLAIVDLELLDGQPGTGTVGNGNGFAEPGETIGLRLSARNDGADAATNVTVSGSVVSPPGVTVLGGAGGLPTLLPGAIATALDPPILFAIDAALPCGTLLDVRVTAAAGGGAACAATEAVRLTTGVPELALAASDLRATTNPAPDLRPHSAFGADVHVTAFEEHAPGAPAIFVARHLSSGGLAELPYPVSGAGTPTAPRIAWGEEAGAFGVAWREAQSGASRIAFQRLGVGGSPAGPILYLGASGSVGEPDVTWTGDHFVVAWPEPAAGAGTIRAQAVSAAGVVISPARHAVAAADVGTAAFSGVALASAPGSFALAARRGSDSALVVRLFPAGPATTALVPLASMSAGATGGGRPALARLGRGYVLAHEDGTGTVRTVTLTGAGAVSAAEVVGAGARPALATGRGLAVLAWELASEVVAQGIGIDGKLFGSAVAASGGVGPSTRPAVSVSDADLALVAWSDRRAENGANEDVRVSLLRPGSARRCAGGVLGDIAPLPGGNGRVDVGDVVLALRVAVGLEALTPEAFARGDVAPGVRTGAVHRVVANGVMDIGDVVVLLQASVGTVTLAR